MDDKGDDIFDRLFTGFFESGFEKQFEEMNKQMEEMFRNIGDIHISVEHFPPNIDDRHGRTAPVGNSPRDQMLKEPDSTPNNLHSVSQQGTSNPDDNSHSRVDSHLGSRPSIFSSIFGDRRGGSPFGPGFRSDQSPADCGCPDNNTGAVSPFDPHRQFRGASSSSTSNNMRYFNGVWSGQTVQTVRHSDGSVEKIVKETENGRTCTTITKTDPNGVSTTSTTCDRPALGPASSDDERPIKPLPPVKPPSQPSNTPGDYDFGDLKKEDASFFSKLFGSRS